MYRKSFGTKNQAEFASAADYYEFLGYLAKDDGSTKLVWEKNDEQGAWAQEGRIHFVVAPPSSLGAKLKHTAGTGSISSRVNCNDYLVHIVKRHEFSYDPPQDRAAIRATVPAAYFADFDRGLAL